MSEATTIGVHVDKVAVHTCCGSKAKLGHVGMSLHPFLKKCQFSAGTQDETRSMVVKLHPATLDNMEEID
jgi:hypothetical protein